MLTSITTVIVVAVMAYALYLEVRRARLVLSLRRWLEEERAEHWDAVHTGKDIEESMKKLRRTRLREDDEFIGRHEAATNRGQKMVIAMSVLGVAGAALLFSITR